MKTQKNYHKKIPVLLLSMLKIRPYADYLAQLSGYELVGEGGSWLNFANYKLFPRSLPGSIKKGDEDPYHAPFKVDITTIRSRVGFSYQEDGWHPFVETLKEYAADPGLDYQDSTLARLYTKYCPRNVQEVLLDHFQTPLKPFCDWPPTNEFIRSVWTLGKPGVDSFMKIQWKQPISAGWIFYGPHDSAYGEREFRRLISVYESIKNKGYNSGLTNLDPVNGYFLKRGKEVRFVLLQGNHRVSVLKALGYKQVEVVIRKGHPALIDRDELHRWTEKGGGIYSASLVRNLFDTLFDSSGSEKAQRLGLLN